jgi:SM-20-related protein
MDRTATLTAAEPQTDRDRALVRAVTERILASLGSGESRPPQPGATEPAHYCLFEEFLSPAEWRTLLQFATDHEPRFQTSRVVSPRNGQGVADHNYRRSRVLFQPAPFETLMADRLRYYFPRILSALKIPPFAVRQFEIQLTASNDGEFFRMHNDNSTQRGRAITFVLFFFAEPRAFSGGALRLYDTRSANGRLIPTRSFVEILPRQNMIVFFPSHLLHEVTTVICPDKSFGSSRFTLNGWIHR